MKKILFIFLIAFLPLQMVAQNQTEYNEELAQKLGADNHGMKTYVFCILKTGSNTTATPEEKQKYFEGHMANISKLADEKKLAVAGPFMKNDRNYRGIFVFNCATIQEAEELVNSDPAVKAGIFEAELTLWYSSAALMQTVEIHKQISKN